MQKLSRVIRLDSVPMAKAYFTPEGFLKDKPVLTSTGIFEYTNPDGSIRRELRLPEDVFDPESLKSYRGKPIVITHDAGLIDKDNVSENQIGTILSEGEQSGSDVRAEIIIHDTDAMKDAGFKELSLGYNLDLDETPGEWHGQHFDARQKNIRINHLALVREARAGEQARLNMDSRDQGNVLKGGKRMSKKIANARRGDAVLSQEEFAKAIDEYKARKAEREKTDADDVNEVEVKEIETQKPQTIEEQVQAVKDRRDRRDEAGDPKDTDEAMSVIAHQDEDLDILFDIIDTLLAKQDFDAADDPEAVEEETVDEEAVEEDSLDKLNKLKKDADEEIVDEEEEIVEDAEDEKLPEDEENVEEEEEIAEDAEDEEVEDIDDEDVEEEELVKDSCDKRMDAADAAASRAIRNHMMMGKIGRQVGLKNLEFKDIKSAKIAIVKAVRPDMRLDGKSDAYINGAFDNACKSIKARKAKDTSYQKRQMFNNDSREVVDVDKRSAADARKQMVARQHNKK